MEEVRFGPALRGRFCVCITPIGRGKKMLRRFAILGAALLCLIALTAPAVWGSVPKIIVIEEFGATW
jgi:hypothetical protein